MVSYKRMCSSESVLNFWLSSTRLYIQWFLIKKRVSLKQNKKKEPLVLYNLRRILRLTNQFHSKKCVLTEKRTGESSGIVQNQTSGFPHGQNKRLIHIVKSKQNINEISLS